MSLDLFVTRLDLDRFAAVQGSRDTGLLDQILAARRQDIADHDTYLAHTGGRPTSLAILIAQIIDGRISTDGVDLYRYEHAATQIADAMGTPCDADVLAETHPAVWRDVDQHIRQARRSMPGTGVRWLTLRELLARGPVLDVPIDPRQRLGTGFLTSDEVQRLADAFAHGPAGEPPGQMPVRASSGCSGEAAQAVAAYQEWVRGAATTSMGLYFHR